MAGGFDLGLLVLQIVVIAGAARLCGATLARIGQPRVIGEMLAGILLGPSVFGALAPDMMAAVFPAASLGVLQALSQIGVLLFMFIVGLDLDVAALRRDTRTAVIASQASIAVPFLLGALAALFLYERFAPSGVAFLPFALFMGAAMSVTAFPVLARILADRGLTNTPLGTVAIACAAVGDVIAWCILAGVIIVARRGDPVDLVTTVVSTAVFVIFMVTVGRRLLRAVTEWTMDDPARQRSGLTIIVLSAIAAAWITDRIGIHPLFGAFLVGALVPKSGGLPELLSARLRGLVALMVPVFFAFTGLRTSIASIATPSAWAVFALILAVAIAGKLGGTAIAARATGMPWRDALALGALMNTRGLMELVILNVGLDIGVLSPTLFAMMVLMAFVTTALTAPLLTWLRIARQST